MKAWSQFPREFGLPTIRVSNPRFGGALARFDAMEIVVIDQTGTPREQEGMLHDVWVVSPRVHVIYLRWDSIHKERRLRALKTCCNQRRNGQAHLLEGDLLPAAALESQQQGPHLTQEALGLTVLKAIRRS